MSGAIDNSTAILCSETGKVSVRRCIDALLDTDETKNTENVISGNEAGSEEQGEINSAYSLATEPQAVSGKSLMKVIHLTLPEMRLMQLGYKEVYKLDVDEYDIEPHISASIPKERDSYVVFNKDYSDICCLREPVDMDKIQGGQVLYQFDDTTECGNTYKWAVLDVFPVCKRKRGFLKYKITSKRRLLLPQKCLSEAVITARYPDSEWRWFLNINVIPQRQ